MNIITKYQCENCYQKHDDIKNIYYCENCDKEVCFNCCDIVDGRHYCMVCGEIERRYR